MPLAFVKRIEIKVKKLVSGKAGYSKYYKEPGKEALAKIISLKKDDLIKNLRDSSPGQQEGIGGGKCAGPEVGELRDDDDRRERLCTADQTPLSETVRFPDDSGKGSYLAPARPP